MKATAAVVTLIFLTVGGQAQTPANGTPAQAPSPATPAASTPTPKIARLTYTPPKNVTAGTRVTGDGGSRGGVKLPALAVLTPDHTGITTRAQPSLFWYQSGAASARFELTVVEPKKPKPLLKVSLEKADQAGIHRLPLGKYNVTLTPGVVYKWTIALVPDPSSRSQDEIASGTIQRAEPDADFTTALAAAEGLDKAVLYASKGFWYDALEVVTNEIDAAPENKALHRERARLLDEAGLKAAAAVDRK
jgi:hypothetical protein